MLLSRRSSTSSCDSNDSSHRQDSVPPIDDSQNGTIDIDNSIFDQTTTSNLESHQTFAHTLYSEFSQTSNSVNGLGSQAGEICRDFGSLNDTIFSAAHILAVPPSLGVPPLKVGVGTPQTSHLENVTPSGLPGVGNITTVNNVSKKNVNSYPSVVENALDANVKKASIFYEQKSPSSWGSTASYSPSAAANSDKKTLYSPPPTLSIDNINDCGDDMARPGRGLKVIAQEIDEDLAPAPATPDAVVAEPEPVFAPLTVSLPLPSDEQGVEHAYWQPGTVVADSITGALSKESAGCFAIRGAHGYYLSATKEFAGNALTEIAKNHIVKKLPVTHALITSFAKIIPSTIAKLQVNCRSKTFDSDDEKWILYRLWNGSNWVVAFQNVASGGFMSVEDGGCLSAHRGEANQWERFELEVDRTDSNNKLVSFKSLKDGTFLCVTKPGVQNKKHVNDCEAICDRREANQWEKFTLVVIV